MRQVLGWMPRYHKAPGIVPGRLGSSLSQAVGGWLEKILSISSHPKQQEQQQQPLVVIKPHQPISCVMCWGRWWVSLWNSCVAGDWHNTVQHSKPRLPSHPFVQSCPLSLFLSVSVVSTHTHLHALQVFYFFKSSDYHVWKAKVSRLSGVDGGLCGWDEDGQTLSAVLKVSSRVRKCWKSYWGSPPAVSL